MDDGDLGINDTTLETEEVPDDLKDNEAKVSIVKNRDEVSDIFKNNVAAIKTTETDIEPVSADVGSNGDVRTISVDGDTETESEGSNATDDMNGQYLSF